MSMLLKIPEYNVLINILILNLIINVMQWNKKNNSSMILEKKTFMKVISDDGTI